MARTKKVITPTETLTNLKQGTKAAALALAEEADEYTKEKYGALNPPAPYITPTGIKPLDALLGGGLVSSKLIAFSSTPETEVFKNEKILLFISNYK